MGLINSSNFTGVCKSEFIKELELLAEYFYNIKIGIRFSENSNGFSFHPVSREDEEGIELYELLEYIYYA